MTSRRRFLAAAGAATGAGITSVALPSAVASASGALPPDPAGVGSGAGTGVWIEGLVIGLNSVGDGGLRDYSYNFQINLNQSTWAMGIYVKLYAIVEGAWTLMYDPGYPSDFYFGGGFGTNFAAYPPTPDPPGNWRAIITQSASPVVNDTASFSGVF